MSWRGMALLAWILAAAGLLRITWPAPHEAGVSVASAVPKLTLQSLTPDALQPVRGLAPSVAAPAPANSPVQPDAMVCARLGRFPTRGWAALVLTRLAHDGRILGESGGYYLVFPGLSPVALRELVGERREQLGALVSASARSESCRP